MITLRLPVKKSPIFRGFFISAPETGFTSSHSWMMPKRKCLSSGKYHFLNQYRVIPGEFRREFKKRHHYWTKSEISRIPGRTFRQWIESKPVIRHVSSHDAVTLPHTSLHICIRVKHDTPTSPTPVLPEPSASFRSYVHASSGLVTEFVFPRESCMWDNFSVRRVIQASSHFRTMTADGIRVMWNERKKEKKHFSFIEVNVLNCVVYKKNNFQ